jgi:chemotaxis protein MotB
VRRFATNWELSTARATRVVRALSESGVDAAAVRLSATGYGEFVPRADNDTEAGRAANRRIELRLLYARDNESADAP